MNGEPIPFHDPPHERRQTRQRCDKRGPERLTPISGAGISSAVIAEGQPRF